jgi:hypothetical protein
VVDTKVLADKGDLPAAKARIKDLETSWNDFFRFPVSGRFDGSMKLWFLRRRCVLCRL